MTPTPLIRGSLAKAVQRKRTATWAVPIDHPTSTLVSAALCTLIALSWTTNASAQEYLVDASGSSGYTTIQDAIDIAPSGSTITIAPGTYVETIDISNTQLTLQNSDPTQQVTIYSPDWSSSGPHLITLDNADVTIRHITIESDAVTYRRPGLELTNATAVLEGVEFLNNTSAIDIDGTCQLDMSNSTVRNLDNGNGIDVSISASGTMNINNCQFFGHHETGGRGLSSMSQQMIINVQDTHFDGHRAATGSGGGVKVNGGMLNLTRVTISLATSPGTPGPGSGAGLFFGGTTQYARLNAIDCTFIGNCAKHSGGASCIRANLGDSILFERCTFRNNRAGTAVTYGGGAAIYTYFYHGSSRGILTVRDCEFTGNSVGRDAAGSVLQVDGGVIVNMSGTTFCSNDEPQFDGAWNDQGGNTFVNECGTGACCIDGNCVKVSEQACTDAFGQWQGLYSVCNTTQCRAACPADITGDRTTNLDDLIEVLSNWGSCP